MWCALSVAVRLTVGILETRDIESERITQLVGEGGFIMCKKRLSILRSSPTILAMMMAVSVLALAPLAVHAAPSGAKAIFDSGEGSTVRMSSGRPAPAPSTTAVASAPRPEKYAGISYKLALLKSNGDFTVVPKSHIFRTGDRVRLLVRSNRPGYLTILNVGSSGNTNVLFNDYVEGRTIYEIPRNTNFRFVGDPGEEKVLIMLSANPNPFGGPAPTTVAQGPSNPPPPPSSGSAPPPPPPPPGPTADAGNLPPPPPMMVASMEGAKDIVLEDDMKTGYAVISPKNGWKPQRSGTKDIVLESTGGENYGVVPVSVMDDGGILTLDVKLRHGR
jgi:hypothetical protein